MIAPLDPFSEVVDGRQRWNPEWYSWLEALAEDVNSHTTTIEQLLTNNVLNYIPEELWASIKNYTNFTDLSSYIQNASNGTPSGGTLYFPFGFYRVEGAGTEAILLTSNQHWVGDGWGSWIYVDTSFPNTRDIVRVAPTTSMRDWGFKKMRIGGGGLARGRNVFHFDLTNGGVTLIVYFVRFEQMLLDAADTGGGGYSLKTTNAAGANLSGGLAYSVFEQNVFDSVYLDYVGDGITFRQNFFDGTLGNKIAFSANNVSGAANLIFTENLMGGYAEGYMSVTGLLNPQITGNWMEQSVDSTNPSGAMMDISGSISQVVRPLIKDNTIAVNIGLTGITAPIRIYNASDTTINDNYIDTATAGGSVHIDIGAPAARTLVGSGGTFRLDGVDTGVVLVSDASATTITPYKQVFVQAVEQSKVGSSPGWVIAGANDLPLVTLPVSVAGAVLITPLVGFTAGDLLLSVIAVGRIESSGSTVTGTLDVRKATAAAGAFIDVSLGSVGPLNFTADTLISSANFVVTGLGSGAPLDGLDVIYSKLTMSTGVDGGVEMGQYIATVYRK